MEAACNQRLPEVLELKDIRGDLHTHTDLTDGVATLEDMVAAAKARGYEYYAITDHAPLLYMQRMTTAKALAQRQRIRELERRTGIQLLHGTELNIQPDGPSTGTTSFCPHSTLSWPRCIPSSASRATR